MTMSNSGILLGIFMKGNRSTHKPPLLTRSDEGYTELLYINFERLYRSKWVFYKYFSLYW